MAGEARIQFSGTATGDPELKFMNDGTPVANFTVAVNRRKKQGDQWVDEGATFYRVAAWKKLAEHVAEAVAKGQRVEIVGSFHARAYEHDGQKKLSLDVTAETVGLSLQFGAPGGGSGGSQQGQQQGFGQQSQWGAQSGQGGWPSQPPMGTGQAPF